VAAATAVLALLDIQKDLPYPSSIAQNETVMVTYSVWLSDMFPLLLRLSP
jgi:hypothetical protein